VRYFGDFAGGVVEMLYFVDEGVLRVENGARDGYCAIYSF
jgi:hypothetical protein